MRALPINDAAPRGGGACIPSIDTVARLPLPKVIEDELYAAAAAAFSPAACQMVIYLGPDLFESRAVQLAVDALIRDQREITYEMTAREMACALAFFKALRECQIIGSERDALHYVRVLANRRYREVLTRQFVWAAKVLRSGGSVDWVRTRINEAFAIAEGEMPFDPQGWAEVAS